MKLINPNATVQDELNRLIVLEHKLKKQSEGCQCSSDYWGGPCDGCQTLFNVSDAVYRLEQLIETEVPE